MALRTVGKVQNWLESAYIFRIRAIDKDRLEEKWVMRKTVLQNTLPYLPSFVHSPYNTVQSRQRLSYLRHLEASGHVSLAVLDTQLTYPLPHSLLQLSPSPSIRHLQALVVSKAFLVVRCASTEYDSSCWIFLGALMSHLHWPRCLTCALANHLGER